MALPVPRDIAGTIGGIFDTNYRDRNSSAKKAHVPTSLLSRYYNELATNKNTLTARNKFITNWSSDNNNVGYPNALNRMFYLIESIELPNLTIGDSDRIDDGRGPYQTHSNSITTTTGNEFSIIYRETQEPLLETFIYTWMNRNSAPFVRPIGLNLDVDYYHDQDGLSSVLTYKIIGVRPQQVKTIDASHDGIKIKLREVTYIFNTIKVEPHRPTPSKPKTNILPRKNKFLEALELATGVAEDVLVKIDNIEKVVDNF